MSDFTPAVITQGNLGSFLDVLRDEFGVAVDLTGASVEFRCQNADAPDTYFSAAATVTSALTGEVKYTAVTGQTDVVGRYQSQWIVTFADTTVKAFPFPGGFNEFVIEPGLPVVRSTAMTLIVDLYETVRAILGDFGDAAGNYRFGDSAIDAVVRTVVNTGQVSTDRTYGVTADRKGITPAINNATDLAVLVYKAAKTFLMPESAEYSFRTRALSERFGAQKHFVFDLENKIAEAEFGDGMLTFQSFYGWVNATTGLNIWTVMTDMEIKAPVATVLISRAGVTVNRA